MYRRLIAIAVACVATLLFGSAVFAFAGPDTDGGADDTGTSETAASNLADEDDTDAVTGPTEVTLNENGGSGVSGTLTIDGTDVTGSADGLDPDKRYISLYYGDQGTATADRALTCADARTAVAVRDWAIMPEWDAAAGTLDGDAARSTDGVETVSIREVPATAGDDPLDGFDPVSYPVVACGVVAEGADLPTDALPALPTLPVTPSDISNDLPTDDLPNALG